MEFLSSPVWQITINAAIGLLTIIVSILIFRMQLKRKSITYEVISDAPVLSIKKEVKGRVQVLFDSKPVSDAHLVILKIWNSGNTHILAEDYIDPIKFDFGKNAEILDAEILETSPNDIKDNRKASLKLDTGSLILEPLFLNSKDSITIKVLLAQTLIIKEIKANGRIVGINQIIKFDKIRNRHPLARTVIYLSYLVLLASVIYLLFSRYENNLNTKIFLIFIIALSALIYIFIYIILLSLLYKFALKIPLSNAIKMVFNKLIELIKFMINETIESN